MEIPKVKVKLNEINEVKFTLSMDGTTSDPSHATPLIRFIIAEEVSGLALCLPVTKLRDDIFSITIPNIPHLFKEETLYSGFIEVIFRDRYFSPEESRINFLFEKEFTVEAKLIMKENVEDIDSEISSISRPIPIKTTKFNSDILQNAIFSETKKSIIQKKPKQEIKPLDKLVSHASTLSSKENQQMKNKIKSILVEAWNELEE